VHPFLGKEKSQANGLGLKKMEKGTNKREPLPKSIRFEVFKRDSFKCHYCGRQAPDVILEVDHIIPVAEGGTNDIFNLVTSCRDCNRGKSKKLLSDDSTIRIQRQRLEDLQVEKEQAMMMVEWRKELSSQMDERVEDINGMVFEKTNGAYDLNERGRSRIKTLIRKYGFAEVYTSSEIAFDTYFCSDGRSFRGEWYSGEESFELAFDKIGAILYRRKWGKA